MSRTHVSQSRSASTGWAHEQQARNVSSSRTAPVVGRGAGVRSEEAPGVTGPGRHLPSRERARMEGHFGRDFSGVRVHTESGAADALGAKAFAYGKDIVFAPGQYEPQSKPGGELLTHELAHIAQQADQGAAAVQKQPKNDKAPQGGIGSSPPSEPFIKGAEVALEDASVLFGFDKAALTPDARAAITQAIGKHKGPVTVEIDGYASSEGQGPSMAEYNLNLSAHRAAAVRAFLIGKLPAGSKFTLVAHGETSDFVPLEQNRRAGFTIRDGVEAPQEAAKKAESAAKKDDTPVSPFGPVVLDPKVTANLYSGSTAPLGPYRPPLAAPFLVPPLGTGMAFSDVDWDGLHSKATDHGLRLDGGLANSLAQHAGYSYQFFLPLFGDKGAKSAANLATNYVFNNFLINENPNAFDRFNLEFQKDNPNEKHLILPILGSDTLDYIRMKIKGTDKDDYKYRF